MKWIGIIAGSFVTLIVIIFVSVGVVWLTYLYVVLQLIRLKRGGPP